MVNNQSNKIEYLMRRREYLLKLRHRASIFQILAVIFLVCGLVTTFVMKAKDFENVWLSVMGLIFLLGGVIFEITALIYFSKAKKHLSGQTVNASTDPRDWN